MKQISNKEYEKYQQYQTDKLHERLDSLTTTDFLAINALFYEKPLNDNMRLRLKHLTEMGIVEHVSRNKYVLARSLYSAAGKPGIHTRRVGLDRETNKELLLKHIHDKGDEGAPLKELQQVLPGHNRGQIQVLLRELRNDGRIHCVGNTSAARWFEGPAFLSFNLDNFCYRFATSATDSC